MDDEHYFILLLYIFLIEMEFAKLSDQNNSSIDLSPLDAVLENEDKLIKSIGSSNNISTNKK